MNKHEFFILPKVEKEIKKLTKKNNELKILLRKAIEAIIIDPYGAGQEKSGDLTGFFSYDIRLQRTSYELAYYLEYNESGDLVIFIAAGSREKFYDNLKVYIKSSGIKPN